MKRKCMVLPLVLLAVAGLLITGCDNGNNNENGSGVTPGTIQDITLKVMNGSGTEATTLPLQLPPGARVVVNATVTVTSGTASTDFTVNVDIPAALTGKITVTDADMDGYPGTKQIQVAENAERNWYEREYVTVTVASVENTTKKDEWKFFVWGNAVTPNNSFAVNDPSLNKLPNLTVSPEDVYENSVPMSDRYRLTGYPVQVFRTDSGKSADDNTCDEYNGMGYISGEELLKLRNAVPESLCRLYFNREHKKVNDDGVIESVDADRNGWGVLKFGNDSLTLNAPNGNQTFYIDASVDNALEAMAANQQDELFVNVFNSRLLKIELWEVLRPITYTNQGNLITPQTSGGTFTMESTGTYATAHEKIRAANEGSFLRITMETPQTQPGWGTAQIGGTSAYFTVNVTPPVTTLESEWVRFTVDMDLWAMYRGSNWVPSQIQNGHLSASQSIRFNVWNVDNGGISGVTGIPIFVSIELWTIDD